MRTTLLFTTLTFSLSAEAFAQSLCAVPMNADFTGDEIDEEPLSLVTTTHAAQIENDFGVSRTSFNWTSGSMSNENDLARRLINGFAYLYMIDDGTWYDRAKVKIVSTLRETNCDAPYGGWYQNGVVRLSDRAVLNYDVVSRAALIVHEAQHQDFVHLSNGACQVTSCDPGWENDRPNTEEVQFIIHASEQIDPFLFNVLESSWIQANTILDKAFESDPGFRLTKTHNGAWGSFQKKYWSCTAVGQYNCPFGGGREWGEGNTEASFFQWPDLPEVLITKIGIGIKNKAGANEDNITTLAVTARGISDDGSLSDEFTEVFGRNPNLADVQMSLSPDEVFGYSGTERRVLTGLMVHAKPSGIDSLGVRYRKWNADTGYLDDTNEYTLWAPGTQFDNQTNISVPVHHALTGVGLKLTNRVVTNSAFNQNIPLTTQSAGGDGGSPYLVKCPSGQVAVGVAASQTPGVSEVRFFALLCAPYAVVKTQKSIVQYVAHGSYYDEGVVLPAGVWQYVGYDFPNHTTQVLCSNGYALDGIGVRTDNTVDRIEDISCHRLSGGLVQEAKFVNVGGTGNNGSVAARLSCLDSIDSFNATVDAISVRTGWSLDRLALHCRDDSARY